MEKYRKDIVEEMNGHGELVVGNQRYRVAYTFSVLQAQSPQSVSAGDSPQRPPTMRIVGRIKAPSRAALIEMASSHNPLLHLSDGRRFGLAVEQDGTAVVTHFEGCISSSAAPAPIPAVTSRKAIPDRPDMRNSIHRFAAKQSTMPKPHPARTLRASQVDVPNQERVVVAVGSKQMIGVLCTLSDTGGSIRLSKSVDEGTFADITLTTTTGKVTGAIEFLRTGVDGVADAHAFRFIHLEPSDCSRLENVLAEMRKQGYGEDRSSPLQPFTNIARRAFGALKRTARFS